MNHNLVPSDAVEGLGGVALAGSEREGDLYPRVRAVTGCIQASSNYGCHESRDLVLKIVGT